MSVMYIRDKDGNLIPVKTIRGAPGPQGEKGADGVIGKDGYTPVRGTDYWTAADKEAIVNDVLSALPTWTGGSY